MGLNRFFNKIQLLAASLFQSETRRLVACDIQRYSMLKKHIALQQLPVFDAESKQFALASTIEWLLLAQRQKSDGGFGSYRLTKGWSSSSIEATGLIIPTLLKFSKIYNDEKIRQQALLAADWLIEKQNSNGSWSGPTASGKIQSLVFTTALAVHGLLAAQNFCKNETYSNAARKACDWICSIQESNGSWLQDTYDNKAGTYDSIIDSVLLEAYHQGGLKLYKECSIRNLDWIIEQKQLNNGWFKDCDWTTKDSEYPSLSAIAYTIEGLIDSGLLLHNDKYVKAGQSAADKLMMVFDQSKYFYGRYNTNWEGDEPLVPDGCAQMSVVWMKLYKTHHSKTYLNAAFRLNDLLCFIQQQQTQSSENSFGAFSGSFPLWGKNEAYTYSHKASKYFADALMSESELRKKH